MGGEAEFTEVIDSAGLVMTKDRRVADRGAGENDGPAYSAQEEVFGASGALALYRAEAIELLRDTSGEVFDEDFFAYKEDVEVAWRLRLLGWKSVFVPQALAYHYRGTGGSDKVGLVEMFKRRLGRSTMVNRFSTRNHLLLLVKNDDWSNRLLHAVWTVPHEIGKFISTLLLSPRALGAYWEALVLAPKMLKKRHALMGARKTSAKEIRAWFK
jgi:GT2 family glycosyltransferase